MTMSPTLSLFPRSASLGAEDGMLVFRWIFDRSFLGWEISAGLGLDIAGCPSHLDLRPEREKGIWDVHRGVGNGTFRPIPLKNSVLEPECHVIKQLEPRLFDKG